MDSVGLTLIIAILQARVAKTLILPLRLKLNSECRRTKVLCAGCHRYFYKAKTTRRHSVKTKSTSCSKCNEKHCIDNGIDKSVQENLCSALNSRIHEVSVCDTSTMKAYQYAAKLTVRSVAANCLLTKNIRHDLYEKDPKERILSETVAYSLQKLEAFNRNTDKIMEIVNSEYNPKMFYEETILLLGVDGNKENWQYLDIQNLDQLREIISRHYF